MDKSHTKTVTKKRNRYIHENKTSINHIPLEITLKDLEDVLKYTKKDKAEDPLGLNQSY